MGAVARLLGLVDRHQIQSATRGHPQDHNEPTDCAASASAPKHQTCRWSIATRSNPSGARTRVGPWIPGDYVIRQPFGVTLLRATPSVCRTTRVEHNSANHLHCGERCRAGNVVPMLADIAVDYPQGLVGATLEGRYRIDSVLAQGGMGTVFRATHLGLNRSVALKILRPDLESDQTQRFLREANIVAQLEHRNCVTVFDYGRSEEGLHFISMQLLQGHPLNEELGRPMDPQRAALVVADILRGLEHAHARNVVHRDLKPDNLFVTQDEDGEECIKLLDFGIAKVKRSGEQQEGAVTLSGLMAGTPAYMSPEHVIGAETDERADLYSTGVIFYELLAGRPPFDTDDPVVLLHHQLNEPFPALPPTVPEPLQAFIRNLSNKEKAKRYASATAALADLDAFLRHTSGGELTAFSSSSTRRWGTGRFPALEPVSIADDDGVETIGHAVEAAPQAGRAWWHWGVAAGLLVLAGSVAFPLVTRSDQVAVATHDTPSVPVDTAGEELSDTAQAPGQVDSSREGLLMLLARVNDPVSPLPYEARRQSLQTLEGSEYAGKVDTRLQVGLDLTQASESATPCRTFRAALGQIGTDTDGYYSAFLESATIPAPGPTETDRDCSGLSNELTSMRGEQPGEANVAAAAPAPKPARPRTTTPRRRHKPTKARSASAPTPAPEAAKEPAARPAKASKPRVSAMKKLDDGLKGM